MKVKEILSKNPLIKKITGDMLINIIGTAAGLLVLQLIIYPLMAKRMDADTYGQMQSVISLVYLVGGALGAALSTTRLIKEFDYNEKGIKADFRVWSLITIGIIAIGMPVVICLYIPGYAAIDVILVTLVALFNSTSNYFEVGLRLKIDYKAIFVNKLLGCAGYFLGFMLFLVFPQWQLVYLISFMIHTVYCAVKTDIFREPLAVSGMFKETSVAFGNIWISTLLSKAFIYFDKLMLYPLLGGTAVSIYYVANIFGKLIMQAIEPITNVILSYLSKGRSVSRTLVKKAMLIALVLCGLGYVVCVFISRFIVSWLYPQWAEAAISLIPIATLNFAISAFVSIMKPFTLKSLDTSKQIILNAVGLVVYIVLALLLYKEFGLMGCCIALLISNCSRTCLILLYCFRGIK